jgi:chorismate-pyruvate lyase
MSTENLLEKILAVPVGKVVDVLEEILNSDIKLQIIEQNTVSPHKFERKVTISSDELPVIKAHAKFDSTVLPEFILDELLKKKQGIGSILIQNNISATRKVISMNHHSDGNKATREYEIIVDGTVWFTILEEIRLENLGASKNS